MATTAISGHSTVHMVGPSESQAKPTHQFEVQSLTGRLVSVSQGVEKTSNTTRMGDVMLSRGVDIAATVALMSEVGHQNGMSDSSSGMISFVSDEKNIVVQPILGATPRGKAQALSAKRGNYPIAWVQVNGQNKLASYNRETGKIEHETFISRNFSEVTPLKQDVPHLLKGLNSLFIKQRVSIPARSQLMSFFVNKGVTHIMTDKNSNVFMAVLKNGTTVNGKVLHGGEFQGKEASAILTSNGVKNVITH